MEFKKLSFGLFIIFSFFFLCSVTAQTKNGKVELIQDPLISILQQKRVEFALSPDSDEGTKHHGETGTTLGFRVQIYTGPSRSEAYAVQARFQKMYSDINSYISYVQPNYRVKIGDFRSRSEAESVMRLLRKDFIAVFLFTEQVNITY